MAAVLDPNTWRRLGLILGGVLLVLVGAWLVLGDAAPITPKTLTNLTKGAAR